MYTVYCIRYSFNVYCVLHSIFIRCILCIAFYIHSMYTVYCNPLYYFALKYSVPKGGQYILQIHSMEMGVGVWGVVEDFFTNSIWIYDSNHEQRNIDSNESPSMTFFLPKVQFKILLIQLTFTILNSIEYSFIWKMGVSPTPTTNSVHLVLIFLLFPTRWLPVQRTRTGKWNESRCSFCLNLQFIIFH